MINYTDRITLLMQDIVERVPPLSFIDLKRVLVFARFGQWGRGGPYATCHCLTLPTSEPGYYFWRDRRTGRLTRRSEWFVTKTPEVRLGSTRLEYLISFALPRFCNQSLGRSRKAALYEGFEPWVAKLDTVVHELYHIDPTDAGIRRVARADGETSGRSHSPEFFEDVARFVRTYLDSRPDPSVYDFLRYDFNELTEKYGGVVGTTFRNFPSFPQRYIEALAGQPEAPGIQIERVKASSQPSCYTEDDLQIRQFLERGSRPLIRKGQHRAA